MDWGTILGGAAALAGTLATAGTAAPALGAAVGGAEGAGAAAAGAATAGAGAAEAAGTVGSLAAQQGAAATAAANATGVAGTAAPSTFQSMLQPLGLGAESTGTMGAANGLQAPAGGVLQAAAGGGEAAGGLNPLAAEPGLAPQMGNGMAGRLANGGQLTPGAVAGAARTQDMQKMAMIAKQAQQANSGVNMMMGPQVSRPAPAAPAMPQTGGVPQMRMVSQNPQQELQRRMSLAQLLNGG